MRSGARPSCAASWDARSTRRNRKRPVPWPSPGTPSSWRSRWRAITRSRRARRWPERRASTPVCAGSSTASCKASSLARPDSSLAHWGPGYPAPRRSLAGELLTPSALGAAFSWGALDVAVVDEAEAFEGEPGLVVLDGARQRHDEDGQTAGGDHGALAQLGLEAVHHRVNLPAEPVGGARLDRF